MEKRLSDLMLWTELSFHTPLYSYDEALTPNEMELGDGALRKWLELDEVMSGGLHDGIGALIRKRGTERVGLSYHL